MSMNSWRLAPASDSVDSRLVSRREWSQGGWVQEAPVEGEGVCSA